MIELTEEQRQELSLPESVAINREHEQDLRPGAKEVPSFGGGAIRAGIRELARYVLSFVYVC